MDSRLISLAPAEPFDLVQTLDSGQVFHWERHTFGGMEGFAGCIGESPPVWVAQGVDGRVWTLAGREAEVERYLGLGQCLSSIHATFPQDDVFLARSIAFCPGLRLIRQPPWECLATFITSSMKQVAHIRAISLTLRERYGKAYQWDGRTFYSYPDPAAIFRAGEAELRQCALGYRARALFLAGDRVASGEIDLETIGTLPADEAVRGLTALYGVGEKIAHCALLFGAGRWEMFPIDVWIERVLRKPYRKRVRGQKLQRWAMRHFGPCAGYAQQYLFHFARKSLTVDF